MQSAILFCIFRFVKIMNLLLPIGLLELLATLWLSGQLPPEIANEVFFGYLLHIHSL